MVTRETLRSPRFLVPAALAALGALLAALILITGCPGERARLRHRVLKLEREKKAAEASAARWKAESKAKAQYLISLTSLLNEVGNRIDQIQQDQQGLAVLTVQRGGDSFRIVKSREIPPALDRIAEQLRKNQEQLGQLEALVDTKSAENQAIRALVERFKKQNEVLDKQLQVLRRSFGVLSKQVKTLETKVVNLETDVGEKEKVIGEKEVVIGEKETQLAEKGRQLEAVEAEKWIRHYIVGTRKELCSLSLIAPCGLFKSLATPRLSDRNIDAFEACGEKCQKVDARNLPEILLGKTRSDTKVLPPRPVGSYSVEKRNGDSYLIIRNPDEFWKARYLVVLVER
jgi:DNA repair exonuclease SbcCD ATPase subunit